MLIQKAFSFSGGSGWGFVRPGGLRLRVACFFQAFLASSPCVASATSYHSCSAAPLPWRCAVSRLAPVFKSGRSLLAFGSNCSFNPDGFAAG
ncbi:DUF1010 domain-containing protein [Comamonas granuli]|uniref:DUF1010 domain-containing protein n=1 Tax=Comamonas granuli TaxID=290309 RepID=UPI0012EBD769|nr:DUF1010 domain-containing protein [Comamonas granuli]